MGLEFLTAEFANLAASVTKQPTVLGVNQLSGDPTLGDTLLASANNNEMPPDVAHRIRQAKAGTGNNYLDGQTYLDGMLYQTGLLPASGDSGVQGIVGELYQKGIDAIDTVAQNPGAVISTLSWPGTGVQVMDSVLDTFGQHIPAVGAVLSNMSPSTRDTILADILQGNFGGVAADAITGVLLPNLAGAALGLLAKQYGLNFGYRPPQPQLVEYYWPDDTPPTFTRTPPTHQVNVGHAGHMEVKLANVPFELPPATNSILPIHGGVQGQQAPGAEAGIRFVHVQNYATLLIPGGAPVYQSLGIQGLMIEFVGAFLGWDQARLLNQDLHKVGYHDPYNPDPLYTDPEKKGGSWQVSRVFLDNAVKGGTAVDFEIFSGVVRIKYQVIVTNYTRWYRDDARTYYKFQCFAVGGIEGGSDADTTLVQRATKETLQAKQDTKIPAGGASNQVLGGGGKITDPAPRTRTATPNGKNFESAAQLVTAAEGKVAKAATAVAAYAATAGQRQLNTVDLTKGDPKLQAAGTAAIGAASSAIDAADTAISQYNNSIGATSMDETVKAAAIAQASGLRERLKPLYTKLNQLRADNNR
jgi:hypothetical protein